MWRARFHKCAGLIQYLRPLGRTQVQSADEEEDANYDKMMMEMVIMRRMTMMMVSIPLVTPSRCARLVPIKTVPFVEWRKFPSLAKEYREFP